MRKGTLGVQNLNQVLQQTLNPAAPDKREVQFRQITFREGDKVMQIKNNYNIVWRMFNSLGKREDEGLGVYNGDAGVILSIDSHAEQLRVAFDDGKVVDYDFSQLEELELAYAITIHKSQGSEYPVVIPADADDAQPALYGGDTRKTACGSGGTAGDGFRYDL